MGSRQLDQSWPLRLAISCLWRVRFFFTFRCEFNQSWPIEFYFILLHPFGPNQRPISTNQRHHSDNAATWIYAPTNPAFITSYREWPWRWSGRCAGRSAQVLSVFAIVESVSWVNSWMDDVCFVLLFCLCVVSLCESERLRVSDIRSGLGTMLDALLEYTTCRRFNQSHSKAHPSRD